MIRRALCLCLSLSVAAGCAPMGAYSGDGAPAPAAEPPPPARVPAVDGAVGPAIISMMDQRRPAKPTAFDFQNTALRDMLKFTTPLGYRLKTRFLEPRVPLVQSLALTVDEQLRARLVEAARWSSTARARAEGLIGIAGESNPAHIKYFKEALLDQDLNIQFAAVEALQLWGLPQGVEFIADAAQRAWTPVVKVYASQALLRLGDQRGRAKLLSYLRDPAWLARAMAARYLGELGKAEDADLLLSRIGAERDNDFVLAEVCIAALKLLAKKAPPPKPERPKPRARPRPVPAPRNPFELEPLIITAPRINVPRNLVDVRIDNDLVRLLEDLANKPPPDEQLLTAFDEELSKLTTPTGFALKVRYSDLSVLLTEGLAGTENYTLITRLEAIARSNPNGRVRASALVALGYQPKRRELSIFDQALRDPNPAVRFAAVEALAALNDDGARSVIAGAAQSDPSAAVRAFSAQILAFFGDPYGRQSLFRYMDDPDWTLRAMAVYGLGEWGDAEDYYTLLARFNRESNDFVLTEMCLALLKLSKRFQ